MKTSNSSNPIRLGAVRYLNTKPLVYGLEQAAPAIDLRFDLPSRLADDLAAGRLDVALIPSIEYFQRPEYSIVSDACIACRGPVLSVKLFFRRPVEETQSLALDEGSRTSAALARILLQDQFGLMPRLEPLPIGAGIADTDADAVLLIGDRAIHSPSGQFAEVWDLGDVWTQTTGLPFVFAMWVARPGLSAGQLTELETALSAARDAGLAHLNEIATQEAAPLGLTRPQCLSYLRDHLHFQLGTAENAGLQRFYEQAVALGLSKRRYPVWIRRTSTGYSADVPDLPGCVATGTTVEHARQMIAEAIEMHLELMRQSNETMPTPTTRIEFDIDDDSAEELCTWVEVEDQTAVTP